MFKEAPKFSTKAIAWIAQQNLWNLWVPKAYGGLESSFTKGLQKLQELAKKDGSLGWTVTLCSGANYFIGNLQPEMANAIFTNPATPICFGGSGGIFGTAEKQGNHFIISGEWHYATGAPYLTHFTLNAKITSGGKPLLNDDETPLVYSFVIPKKDITIIENWNTMGLKATATHSFKVESIVVPANHAFIYNQFYLPQPIFKIPFSVFADLTLWVNYLGMAEHFLEKASEILEAEVYKSFALTLTKANQELYGFAEHIEALTTNKTDISKEYIEQIHTSAATSVKNISKAIINIFPHLGVNACRKNHPLNQIFRDYFTATQHHIFSGKD